MHYNQTRFLRRIRQAILAMRWGRLAVLSKGRGKDPEYALLNFSRQFDVDFYVSHYPGKYPNADPVKHYVVEGYLHHYDPAPWFNTKKYLERYGHQLGGIKNPFLHYLLKGRQEGLKCEESLLPKTDYSYEDWVALYDTLTPADTEVIRKQIDALPVKPLISVIMPVYNPPVRFLKKAIESVLDQIYPQWELCIADDGSKPRVHQVLKAYALRDARIKICYRPTHGHISAASNSALELATGDLVGLLDHDDVIPPHALFAVAHAAVKHSHAMIIFSDEDKIDSKGNRYDPYFKSDWNRALFYSQNCISHLGIFKRQLLIDIGGFREGVEGSQDYDLVLRALERIDGDSIIHIPHILYHWRATRRSTAKNIGAKNYALQAGLRALNEHLIRTNQPGRAEVVIETQYRVRWELDNTPQLVSIIIPFRDQLSLLQRCVETLLDKTAYKNFELILVDNNSTDPDVKPYLADITMDHRVKTMACNRPFNFSAINNFAVAQAAGDYLCFLNNDTEIIAEDWLTEIVSQLQRPLVGAVGAKLLYPDNTMQHAGVILGMGGVAGHRFRGQHRKDNGIFGRASLTQNLSCVTAACMIVRRTVFDEVGGFDEALRVAFNDVDLCLKLRKAGYLITYTPFSLLYHHESKTRGSDMHGERKAEFEKEVEYIKEKWGEVVYNDPYYNKNLTLDKANYSLSFPPRIKYPWQES